MDGLVQQDSTAINAGLRQPDAVRTRLADHTGTTGQFVISYGVRIPGQSQLKSSTTPFLHELATIFVTTSVNIIRSENHILTKGEPC